MHKGFPEISLTLRFLNNFLQNLRQEVNNLKVNFHFSLQWKLYGNMKFFECDRKSKQR